MATRMPRPTALMTGVGAGMFAVIAPAQYQIGRFEPPAGFGGMVAYEPNSAHAYALTGTGLNEIWRYDAGTWVRVTTPSPRPQTITAMATWPGHGVLALSGGHSWLFDGADWRPFAVVGTTPSASLMAFDPARQVMVAAVSFGPTFDFDGTTWRQVSASTPQSARLVAWCANRQRVLLMASAGLDTRAYYTWDGSGWAFEEYDYGPLDGVTMAPCATGDVMVQGGYRFPFTYGGPRLWPSHVAAGVTVRYALCSWYDIGRQATVMTTAGGAYGGNYTAWEFRGGALQYSAAGRRPFGPSAVAYDSWRGQACMYGGLDDLDQEHGELWVSRDTDWAYRSSSGRLQRPGMAFDSRRGRMVVFGGGLFDHGGGSWFPGAPLIQEWDGSGWHTYLPTVSPPARLDPQLAFDRARGRIVLYGGVALPSEVPLNDTAEWDGTAWTLCTPTVAPPTNAFGLTFDSSLGRCVLAAGGTLFAWDGSNWSIQGTAPFDALAYDESRDRLIAFGYAGEFERNGTTWTPISYGTLEGAGAFHGGMGSVVGYDSRGTFTIGVPGAAQVQPFGTGCAGTAGTPVLHGERPPRLQRVLDLRVENLPAAGLFVGVLGGEENDWLGAPLPFALDAFGMPGCTLYAAVDIHELRRGADWPIPVPGDPALLGATCRAQALVADPGANGFGATTTNGVRLRVGN